MSERTEPEFVRFVELLPDAILLLSGQGQIQVANREIAKQLGIAPAALVGRDLATLVEDEEAAVTSQLRLWTKSSTLIPGSLTFRLGSGGVLRYRCDGGVLRPPHNGALVLVLLRLVPKDRSVTQYLILNERIAALGREIAHRQRLESEREGLLAAEREARLEAERANRAKDEFLAVVSHELRTPLTPILSWAHMLRTRPIDPATTTKALETIERSARSQAQIIDDLLDISRITAGKVRLDVRPLDLAPIIGAAIEAIQPAADAKGIRIIAVIDPRTGMVSGDGERLQQVVWNLVSNAVKFTPRGGRVEVVLQRANSHVEIVVSDSGQGIKPEFLPYVFDRFRQGEGTTTTRLFGGLGLGLAIVRHLIELHGGTVTCESAGDGLGAMFTVGLPLTVVQAVPGPEMSHPRAADDLPPEHSLPRIADVKILIVDDERDTLEILEVILSGEDAEVRTARSAQAALAVLAEWTPDLLISDIGMPEEDGYSLIRKVRDLPATHGGDVPALALTAFARVEDRLRILSSGFQMHVSKPVDPAELIVMVANLAGWRGRPIRP